MAIKLSDACESRLTRVFAGNDLAQARELLENDCGDSIGGHPDKASWLDRVRIAAIKASNGRLDQLVEAIVLAQTDWRDLLVGAGFADDVRAHESWWPDSTL